MNNGYDTMYKLNEFLLDECACTRSNPLYNIHQYSAPVLMNLCVLHTFLIIMYIFHIESLTAHQLEYRYEMKWISHHSPMSRGMGDINSFRLFHSGLELVSCKNCYCN